MVRLFDHKNLTICGRGCVWMTERRRAPYHQVLTKNCSDSQGRSATWISVLFTNFAFAGGFLKIAENVEQSETGEYQSTRIAQLHTRARPMTLRSASVRTSMTSF